jgi:hypothetical protein
MCMADKSGKFEGAEQFSQRDLARRGEVWSHVVAFNKSIYMLAKAGC